MEETSELNERNELLGAYGPASISAASAMTGTPNDHDSGGVDGSERDPSPNPVDEEVFAAGENMPAGGTGLSTTPDSPPSQAQPAAVKSNAAHYKNRLAVFRKRVALATGSDGEARGHRNTFLVDVATLVHEVGFNANDFSIVAKLKFTKATLKNPSILVIQAGLEHVDRKLASKWGIALEFAVRKSGGLTKLREFLDAHTIEQCLKGARDEKRSPRRPRTSSLKVTGVPSLADGRVFLTVDVVNGEGRFVSQAAVEINPIAPGAPGISPGAFSGHTPPPEKAPGEADGSGPSSFGPVASDCRGDDVAGDPTAAREVPAAA